MADGNKVIEVQVGATIQKHQGDSITVDDKGNLLIHLGSETEAIYPSGGWIRAYRSGNILPK